MPDLDISASDEHVYDVVITADDDSVSRHRVTVPDDFLASNGVASAQEPLLVRASLEYLLDHEPPSSIMAAFTLADISRFFPGYPGDVLPMI